MKSGLRETVLSAASAFVRRAVQPLVDRRLGELSDEAVALREQLARTELRVAELTESVAGLVDQMREPRK